MSTLLMHLIIIAILILAASALYVWLHPEIFEHEVALSSEENPMVVKFVHDYWDLYIEIQNATSKAEVESLYWEVEIFEQTYRGLVPDDLLKNRIDQLYDKVSDSRDRVNRIILKTA